MKFLTTKKAIRNSGCKVYKVGYCKLQYLLNYKLASAYSTRLEGWACDYYTISPNIIISTGYSPIGEDIDYQVIDKLEHEARAICCSLDNWDKKEEELDALINQLVSYLETK